MIDYSDEDFDCCQDLANLLKETDRINGVDVDSHEYERNSFLLASEIANNARM